MYVRLMSEAHFENVEQTQKGTGTSAGVCLKAVEKNDWCISVETGKAANSLWELIISSVSCLLLLFFNHMSLHLRHTLAKMHEGQVI